MLFACIIDQDIDFAELSECLSDDFATEFLVAHVPVDEQAFAAMLLHEMGGFFCIPMLFEVDHAHVRALFGERNRDSAADPTVAAGDDGDFAVQFATARLAFILRLWTRLHLVLASRTLPLMLSRLALFLFWHPSFRFSDGSQSAAQERLHDFFLCEDVHVEAVHQTSVVADVGGFREAVHFCG